MEDHINSVNRKVGKRFYQNQLIQNWFIIPCSKSEKYNILLPILSIFRVTWPQKPKKDVSFYTRTCIKIKAVDSTFILVWSLPKSVQNLPKNNKKWKKRKVCLSKFSRSLGTMNGGPLWAGHHSLELPRDPTWRSEDIAEIHFLDADKEKKKRPNSTGVSNYAKAWIGCKVSEVLYRSTKIRGSDVIALQIQSSGMVKCLRSFSVDFWRAQYAK